jgi:hypothetical protein
MMPQMTPQSPRLRDRVGPERTAAILAGLVIAGAAVVVGAQPTAPPGPGPTPTPVVSAPGSPAPTPSPALTASPSESPTASATPSDGSPTPGRSASPPPPPTPTPLPTPRPPAGSIQNGGFEEGRTEPWLLVTVQGAAATLALDGQLPAYGATSARVVVTAGGDARAGISLRQGGLVVTTGTRYAVRLRLRAAELREVRIRVSAPGDATLATRLVIAGTAWAETTFEFTALVTTTEAIVAIDLGRSTVTTWVDEVSLTPIR